MEAIKCRRLTPLPCARPAFRRGWAVFDLFYIVFNQSIFFISIRAYNSVIENNIAGKNTCGFPILRVAKQKKGRMKITRVDGASQFQ